MATLSLAITHTIMNRDALLATLIGLGMGLFITGIIVVGPNLLKLIAKISFPKFSLQTAKRATATPTPTPVFSLTIDSPMTDRVVNTSDLLVSGNTSPGAIVVVAGNSNEDVIAADATGNYAGKVTLAEGKNDLTVTSYSREKKDSKTVTIFYIQ